MPLTLAERNAGADFFAGRCGFISLHTADPGTTGANEASGSGYARQTGSFPASTTGTATAAKVTFTVAGGITYTHFGFWSAATGGTFRGGNPLSPSQTPGATGPIDVTASIPVTAG